MANTYHEELQKKIDRKKRDIERWEFRRKQVEATLCFLKKMHREPDFQAGLDALEDRIKYQTRLIESAYEKIDRYTEMFEYDEPESLQLKNSRL